MPAKPGPPSSSEHPAEIYARDAANGRIRCSKYVQLSAKRHFDDLKDGHKRGLRFDPSAAIYAINFFALLRQYKGREWKGRPLTLEPWQQFILWCVYGWKKADGFRRFRTAHIEVAKGNGKSTMCAGIGLQLLVADGEAGAEIYVAATKKDQARILFGDAVAMRDASPSLVRKVQKFRDNLSILAEHSKFEPLGADKDTLDGPRPHGLLLDELHAWKSRGLLDVLEEGLGKRQQSLSVRITTASDGSEGVYDQEHDYTVKVLEGTVVDDSLFGYIACLDDKDDAFDERNWIKANPNLGVSVKVEELRDRAVKAKAQPSYLNSFLRFRMNRVTQGDQAAIDIAAWNKCVGFTLKGTDARELRERKEKELEGRECFMAGDLASTDDICATGKIFPPRSAKEPIIFIPHFWVPEDNLKERMKEQRAPYDVWEREGFLLTTDGNVVDYDVIEKQVISDFNRYNVQEFAFDPWNATQFSNNLQKGGVPVDKLVKFAQTITMFAEPTKKLLEVLIPNRQLAHLGNPVLKWMAGNLVVREDPNGSKRPVKKTKRGKIDGIVALLMAYGRMIATPTSGPSTYEKNGILVL